MRKAFYYFLIPVSLLLSSSKLSAQSWQWARGTNSPAGGCFTESWPVTTDNFGNSFISGIIVPTTVTGSDMFTMFGTHQLIDTNNVQDQMYVAKLNANGTFQWVIGSQYRPVVPSSLVADAQGNVYVFGNYCSSTIDFGGYIIPHTGTCDYFIAKLDSTGHIKWVKNVVGLDSNSQNSTGGMGIDRKGNLYVSGCFPGPSVTIGTTTLTNTDLTGVTYDIFVAKFDSGGNNIWAKSYGGDASDYIYGMAATEDGQVYFGGFSFSDSMVFGTSTVIDPSASTGVPIAFIAKVDTLGNRLWARSAAINKFDGFGSVATDPADNVYFTGSYLNPTITFGTHTLTNAGGFDAYLVKYDANGNLIFANSAGGANVDNGHGVAVDSCENVWMSGSLGPPGLTGYSINIGSHVLAEPASSYDPIFLAEFDNIGNYITSVAIQSGGDDESGLAMDKVGNLYLACDYYQPTFMLGPDTLILGLSQENIFAAKYNYNAAGACAALAVCNTPHPADMRIFPNPGHDQISIISPVAVEKVEVVNMMGQLVYSNAFNSENVTINVASLPGGVYMIRVNDQYKQKFVKQ